MLVHLYSMSSMISLYKKKKLAKKISDDKIKNQITLKERPFIHFTSNRANATLNDFQFCKFFIFSHSVETVHTIINIENRIYWENKEDPLLLKYYLLYDS